MNKIKVLLWLSLFLMFSLHAQTMRSHRDTVGYCWYPSQMKQLISYLQRIEQDSLPSVPFIAGISPHDDFLYAARVYYPLFRSIKSKEVVIFGVTHATVRREIGDPKDILLLDSFPEWSGIGKPVHPSPLREQIIALLDTSFYRIDNKAQGLEHSIEALIPFLQYFNPEIRITPIMVTAMQFERMSVIASKLGSVIAAYIKSRNLVLGRDIFFLISADANHYGQDFQNVPFGEDSAAHILGINQDRRIAQSYIEGPITDAKVQDFIGEMKNVIWCGKFSIPFGLLTAEKVVEQTTGKHLHSRILRYSDTYTEGVLPIEGTNMGTTAPHSLKHWVGFLSAGFTLE